MAEWFILVEAESGGNITQEHSLKLFVSYRQLYQKQGHRFLEKTALASPAQRNSLMVGVGVVRTGPSAQLYTARCSDLKRS